MLNGKSYKCTHAKGILGHALTVWSIVKNSSVLLLYFFNLLLSFLFCVFFFVPFLWIPFRVIYYGFFTIFSIHVRVRCWEFSYSISPLLEPSTLSYKTACLLFRHHLHINAARELVGQYLMRGDSTSWYLFFLILILYLFIPFVAKSFWNVILRDWEVYWPPRTEVPRWSLSSDTVKFHIGIIYLFLRYSFHLFLCWSSSDTLLSSDWVLGHRPSPF